MDEIQPLKEKKPTVATQGKRALRSDIVIASVTSFQIRGPPSFD